MLEELSVAGLEDDQTTTARSLDDDGIERLLKNSNKLRLLDVRGCIRLSDSGLVRVPAWDLEHLFLSGNFWLFSTYMWYILVWRALCMFSKCVSIALFEYFIPSAVTLFDPK